MVTLGTPSSTATLLPRSRSFVFVAEKWNDPWRFQPYLTPLRCVDAVAPEVGSCDLLYDVGRLKQHDTTSFATYDSLDLRDQFVQVRVQYPGYAPQAVWTGVITETQMSLDRSGSLSGPQAMKAYGLGHLLDRKIVTEAMVYDQALVQEGDTGAVRIDWVPKVNERWKKGKTLHGNRTSEDIIEGGIYLYDHANEGGDSWTNRQYAEYTMHFFTGSGNEPDWQFTGDLDSLDALIGTYEVDRMSVWQILNQLINRRHGLGFCLDYDGTSATVFIRVFTIVEDNVTYETATLSANEHQTFFAMPTAFPAEHEVGDVPLRLTTVNKYEQIIIQGERVIAVGNFKKDVSTLEPTWTPAVEAVYLAATGTDDTQANTRFRSREMITDAFTSFRVPNNWNGDVFDPLIIGGGDPRNMIFWANEDGTFTDEQKSFFWRKAMRFERQLPFQKGVNYSVSPLVDNTNFIDTEIEYKPLMALILDSASGDRHTADNKSHYVEHLDRDFPDAGIKGMSVRPLDNELGIKLHVTPSHYLALNHWAGAKLDDVQPEFDYENLTVIGAIKLDVRPTIVIDLRTDAQFEDDSEVGRVPRRLQIFVPGVEYWRAAKDTVWDISSDGLMTRIHDDNVILRDDTEKLHAHAAFARAWYGVERQAVQIPIKRMGVFVPLGTMITGIANVAHWVEVNTVVTGRVIDFVSRTTVIETGHNAQDMISPLLADIGTVKGRSNIGGRRG